MPVWQGQEGPRSQVVVGPGLVGVRRRDRGRRERTLERIEAAHRQAADLQAGWVGEIPIRVPMRVIRNWSRKSRANMHKAFRELDFSEIMLPHRPPALVTLTYPGEWLVVAPNGKAAKRHLDMFRRAYRDAWGDSVVGFWKLEFMRRGAPHFHLLICPPQGKAQAGRGTGLPFKQWLSLVWAAIVAHPDPEQYRRHVRAGTGVDYAQGLRMRNPQAAVTYFAKHSDFSGKEYQHIVPEPWREPGQGPGRFWGYWKMQRVAVAVDVDHRTAHLVGRILRRLSRALHITHQVKAPRTPGGRAIPQDWQVVGLAGAQLVEHQAPTGRRRIRRRAIRLRNGVGWESAIDGPSTLLKIWRAIDIWAPRPRPGYA
ncbi:MAG TPA: hypothetical protein VHA75_17760 [Rugosimonospora sp.]|nr:hypothetical protein [Rugosimonospora sp.]